MMGHRGCRIGVTAPEIYQTQVRAIFEAACHLSREGVIVRPEVMIPLVATDGELRICRESAVQVAEEVMAEQGTSVDYSVGTMIELPRAALLAKEVAKHADFFSFGTNDLTQMTYGFSRDDMGKFLTPYLGAGILRDSPSPALTSKELVNWCKWEPSEADTAMHDSKSVSVANTVVTRRALDSSTKSDLTTSLFPVPRSRGPVGCGTCQFGFAVMKSLFLLIGLAGCLPKGPTHCNRSPLTPACRVRCNIQQRRHWTQHPEWGSTSRT